MEIDYNTYQGRNINEIGNSPLELNTGKRAAMKYPFIIFFNTSENIGGAAIAARRLLNALQGKEIYTKMIVRDKSSSSNDIISTNSNLFNKIRNRFYFLSERFTIFISNNFSKKKLFAVSIANQSIDISKWEIIKKADVLHLHWINQGFISLRTLEKLINLNKPIIWTMHDMWPSTAICHYSYDCQNYIYNCGNCPFLNSDRKNDLSYRTWKKKSFINHSNIHIVTVSTWLKNIVQGSSLTNNLAITVIPNVIDTSIFKPGDKNKIRLREGFPLNKKIILMGAIRIDDPNKGFLYLKESIDKLVHMNEYKEELILILFGKIKNQQLISENLSIPYIHLDSLTNPEQIAKLYIAADVTVIPSEYETFGQTILESLACGCPAVSFNNSGQTDILDHKKNGYLAKYKDTEDLAKGIKWGLENGSDPTVIKACIDKVNTHFSEKVITEKYLSLYKKLLNK